jgi:DNA-directed RNA polymerase subunit RPC12/RpoP
MTPNRFNDATEKTKCPECGSRRYVYQGDNQAECLKCWDKFDARIHREPKKSNPMTTTHQLKTWPRYFEAIRSGEKTWEFRKDDRNYQVGDALCLREWSDVAETYTGRVEVRHVTYIARGELIPEGYCVMSVITPIREMCSL